MNRPLFTLLLIFTSCLFVSLSAAAQTPSSASSAKKETTSALSDTTGIRLGEASATATRLLFVTKKDTVVFDLDALVNEQGASLGDALKKLPGMEIRGGALYFNGKRVERLMVNGIDFSRDNPQLALSNLPAYIVKHVKAYERKSDEAMATGIDDGVRNQVVDVILRKEYNGTWTGEGRAAGGTSHTFSMRGFANTFTDRFRITLFGNANNINQQMWYNGDGSEESYYNGPGRNTYRSPGASFFWKTNKEEGKRGYFLFEMSGDYNHDGFRSEDRNETENYLEMGNTYSARHGKSRGGESRWAAHPSLKWNPTDWTYLHFRADMYSSKMETRSRSSSAKWSENPFASVANALDSLLNHPEGWPNPKAVTTLMRNESKNEVHTSNYTHNLYLTQRLSENNWRFVFRHQVHHTTNNSYNFSINDYRYYQSTEKPRELLNRYLVGNYHNRGQMSFFDLNIPVLKHGFLRTTYGFTTHRSKGQHDGYLLNLLGSPYNDYATAVPLIGLLPDGVAQWQAAAREAETSRNTDTYLRKHWAELYWQYSRKGWYFQTQATLRFAHETLDYEKATYAPLNYRRHFRDGNVSSLLKYENDSIGRFELDYDYEYVAPPLLSMITIPDYSDPLRISLGNPSLKPKQSHDFSLTYFKVKENGKGRFFNFLRASVAFKFWENEILYAQAYNRTTGVTTSMPVNVNGIWVGNAYLYAGLPWEKTWNGSLGIYYNLSHRKGMETMSDFSQLRFQTTNFHTIRWGGRISYHKGGFEVHLPFHHEYTYYDSDYTEINGRSTNVFSLSPQLTWKLPRHFEVSGSTRFHFIRGYGSDMARRNRADVEFRVARTFFKAQNLTVYLEGKDLLAHNDGYNANVMPTHYSRNYSETLGRYVMLGLTYRFSTKK